MSSASSSSPSSASLFPTSGLAIPPCRCGLAPRIRISRTDANPNKKFFVCPVGKCGFWEWEEKLELEAMKKELRRLREDVEDLKHKLFTLMAVCGFFSLCICSSRGKFNIFELCMCS